MPAPKLTQESSEAGNPRLRIAGARRFGLDRLEGYAYPQEDLHRAGIEPLARIPESALIPYDQVRALNFMREFGAHPETHQRRGFDSRPKLGGLCVRTGFLDDEQLEGVMPDDLTVIGRPPRIMDAARPRTAPGQMSHFR